MKRILVVLLLFALSITLNSAPVKTLILGTFPSGAEKIIRLYEYTNFISYQPRKIAQTQITNNGSFKFELAMEKGEVKTFFFAVERFSSYEVFIEAGKTYNFIFDSLDFSIQDEWYSPLTSAYPKLTFQSVGQNNDLNNQINELIAEFVRFTVEDFSEIMKMRKFSKFDAFRNRLDSMFKHIDHPFFKTMLEYTFAEIELTARSRSYPMLVGMYLYDRPFQYEHPAFMNFFNQFFDKYIYAVSRKIQFNTLEQHIVKQPNYKALLDSLGKDTLLKNEVVRDMVLIKNLHQMYFANVLNRQSIYNMMIFISKESKFKKHREIASELLPEMTLHLDKQKAPPLTGRHSDGSFFSLDTIGGMYTYIFFFTTFCRMCYSEFLVMNKLYEKYKNDVHFISFSMDVNFLKFYYFMQDYKFPWHFANFNKNFDLEDQWNVKIFPQAIMLDPNGYIINQNAPLPSEDLDGYIKKLLTQ